jgi:hypothetical protein
MQQITIATCLVACLLSTHNTSAKVLADGAVPVTNDISALRDATVVAQVQTLDRLQTEQERLKQLTQGRPKAYEDKFMDSSALPVSMDDAALPGLDASGFRSYLIENRLGYASTDGTGINTQRGSETGLRAEYRFETLNYGEFAIQADMRSRLGDQNLNFSSSGLSTEKSNGRLILRNLGFPLTPNTFADTSLGDISSETTDGLTRHYRFSLGSNTVRGVSTHVFNRSTDVRAGVGDRGNLVGGPYAGFEPSQGRLAWLGFTQRFAGHLFAGLQINYAQGIPVQASSNSVTPANNLENANTLAASIGYGYELAADGDKKARITVLSSRTSANVTGRSKDATGVFLEGGFKEGRYRNEMGAYWTAPSLHFGDYTAATGTRGTYWRVDHTGSRLNWGAGFDYEQQNPNRSPDQVSSDRLTLNLNAQHVIDRNSSTGINLSINQNRYHNDSAISRIYTGYNSNSYFVSAFYQTRISGWGRSRITATLRRNQTLVTNGVAATGEEIAWEHDWVTGKFESMRPEFTTTLGFARDRSNDQIQTYPTAGLVFRYWPNADWNLGGNLQYSARSGNLSTSRGLSGSFSADRMLGDGWRMGATASLNQAVVNVSGSTLNAPSVSRSNEKSAFVYLRYEGANGTPYQTLGNRNEGSAGSGSIAGTVFFDLNRDDSQQASELGVPNVEVLLDGRYRVTTDKDGRFEFQLVATGKHLLTLKLESVPLPWGLTRDQGLTVDVPLRGQATAAMPVVKLGD